MTDAPNEQDESEVEDNTCEEYQLECGAPGSRANNPVPAQDYTVLYSLKRPKRRDMKLILKKRRLEEFKKVIEEFSKDP